MLNLDFKTRLIVSTDDIQWQPSGIEGIDIKPLAIEDSETGHLTGLVRYKSGSTFTRKEQSFGEEMLILNGSFNGQYKEYKTGTYYRSPPNNEQIPLSQQGCVMFLKLNQFEKQDEKNIEVNISESDWTEISDAISLQILHKYKQQLTVIYTWKEGTEISLPSNTAGSEIFILKGCIEDYQGKYTAGTWIRTPDRLFNNGICRKDSAAFIKYGHLPL